MQACDREDTAAGGDSINSYYSFNSSSDKCGHAAVRTRRPGKSKILCIRKIPPNPGSELHKPLIKPIPYRSYRFHSIFVVSKFFTQTGNLNIY